LFHPEGFPSILNLDFGVIIFCQLSFSIEKGATNQPPGLSK